jgi:hypothetical protein
MLYGHTLWKKMQNLPLLKQVVYRVATGVKKINGTVYKCIYKYV